MSIKIYNGYKSRTSNLNRIFNYLEKIKKETDPIFKEKFAKAVYKIFFSYLDSGEDSLSRFKNEFKNVKARKDFIIKNKSVDLFDIQRLCEERVKNILKSRIRDVNVDVLLELNIYSVSNKTVLINAIYEDNENIKSILDKYFIEYYYYNNTDKPDNISSREWRKREKHWLKAFKLKPLCWINFDLLNYESILTYQELKDLYDKCKPTIEQRATEKALRELDKIYYKKHKEFSYIEWRKFLSDNKDKLVDLIKEYKEKLCDYDISDINEINIDLC